MKNQIITTILLTSLFWLLGCYMYWDLTKAECVDCKEVIEANNKKYQNELDSLQLVRDSLNQEVTIANSKTDSLKVSIAIRNRELNKLRKKYNETVANIDSMSNDELSEFFANRYH